MIVAVIVFIFCVLGIYGYYDGNFLLTYIGAMLWIIQEFIGISTSQQKGCTTTIISMLIGIALTIAGNNFFQSISVCLCFENVICFVGGLIFMLIMSLSLKK